VLTPESVDKQNVLSTASFIVAESSEEESINQCSKFPCSCSLPN
jgi:hypothetical protein